MRAGDHARGPPAQRRPLLADPRELQLHKLAAVLSLLCSALSGPQLSLRPPGEPGSPGGPHAGTPGAVERLVGLLHGTAAVQAPGGRLWLSAGPSSVYARQESLARPGDPRGPPAEPWEPPAHPGPPLVPDGPDLSTPPAYWLGTRQARRPGTWRYNQHFENFLIFFPGTWGYDRHLEDFLTPRSSVTRRATRPLLPGLKHLSPAVSAGWGPAAPAPRGPGDMTDT